MIPNTKDLETLRSTLENAAGLDPELSRRCTTLLRLGAYDEAVRNAFVLLEERLRENSPKEGLTGSQLANAAFSADSVLTKQLGQTPAEREGVRELYSGAFKLFRNPSAHRSVGYSDAEGKAILALVNLLLLLLTRASTEPAGRQLPSRVETAVSMIEQASGVAAANRLRAFVTKSLALGLTPKTNAKQWIPFQRMAMVKNEDWTKPKPHPVAVYYLTIDRVVGLWFPIRQYYSNVLGLDLKPIGATLKSLGFTISRGKTQDFYLSLMQPPNQQFFDELGNLVESIVRKLDATLPV